MDIKVPPHQAGEVVKSLEKHMDETFAKLSAVERFETSMTATLEQFRSEMNVKFAEVNVRFAEMRAEHAKSHKGLLMAMIAVQALSVLILKLT